MNEQKGKEVASDVAAVSICPQPMILTPGLGYKELPDTAGSAWSLRWDKEMMAWVTTGLELWRLGFF